jgi:DNA-directed RNA polymerase specialized sigma subunit
MADVDREKELIQRYQEGDSSALPELFDSFRPVLKSWERKTASTNLPRSAVNAEIKRQFVDAIGTYDTSRDTKPVTWVNNRMPKIYRFIYDHQNIGRIPENINMKVGSFKSAKNTLSDKLGRDPTTSEMSDELGWGMAEVANLEHMVRADLSLPSEFEFGAVTTNRAADLMHYIYYDLTPQEKIVFEHITGMGGKKVLKSKEIAVKMGVSQSTVSNIKKSIAKKLESARG